MHPHPLPCRWGIIAHLETYLITDLSIGHWKSLAVVPLDLGPVS